MKVVVRISSSIITSLLISITIAWEDKITVIREIESVDYSSFIENLLIFLIPLTLLFLIFAVPYSIFVDQAVKAIRINRVLREITSMLFYGIGGAASVFIFIVLLSWSFRGVNNVGLLLIGGIMGLAYYVVVRGMEYVVKRWTRRRVKV